MVKNNVFSKLDKRIVEILRKLGIERPTLIQELAIEFLLRSDENVILVAPTGAGKQKPLSSQYYLKCLKEGNWTQ